VECPVVLLYLVPVAPVEGRISSRHLRLMRTTGLTSKYYIYEGSLYWGESRGRISYYFSYSLYQQHMWKVLSLQKALVACETNNWATTEIFIIKITKWEGAGDGFPITFHIS